MFICIINIYEQTNNSVTKMFVTVKNEHTYEMLKRIKLVVSKLYLITNNKKKLNKMCNK